jgi:hypothetical protein
MSHGIIETARKDRLYVDFSPARGVVMFHDDRLTEWFAHRAGLNADTWHVYSRATDGALDHAGIVRATADPTPKQLYALMIQAGIAPS